MSYEHSLELDIHREARSVKLRTRSILKRANDQVDHESSNMGVGYPITWTGLFGCLQAIVRPLSVILSKDS